MKTRCFFLCLCLVGFFDTALGQQDSINPNIDIRVNKEYDENGNIISYDSVYSYSYSSADDAFLSLFNDSMLLDFSFFPDNPDFFFHHPMEHFKSVDSMYFDSIFFHDFFGDGFFFQNDSSFKYMMPHDMFDFIEQMDSLQQKYYTKPPPSDNFEK